MAGKKPFEKINDLIQREAWEEARKFLRRELEKDPQDHWILTQLGVTFYEQRRYEKALETFLSSREIVPDCPLTLWNLAGALDALGKHGDAIRFYTWILQSKRSPKDDPCWESKEWTDALKADCVYRLGVCFQHMRKKQKAKHCYRQYLDLLSLGIEGSYSIDDVQRQMRGLQGAGRPRSFETDVRKAVEATLEAAGVEPTNGRRNAPPEIDRRRLLSGGQSTTKP